LTGSSAPIEFRPLPADDPRQRRPDIRRARQLLQFEPAIPLREGLSRTVADFRERLNEPGALCYASAFATSLSRRVPSLEASRTEARPRRAPAPWLNAGAEARRAAASGRSLGARAPSRAATRAAGAGFARGPCATRAPGRDRRASAAPRAGAAGGRPC